MSCSGDRRSRRSLRGREGGPSKSTIMTSPPSVQDVAQLEVAMDPDADRGQGTGQQRAQLRVGRCGEVGQRGGPGQLPPRRRGARRGVRWPPRGTDRGSPGRALAGTARRTARARTRAARRPGRGPRGAPPARCPMSRRSLPRRPSPPAPPHRAPPTDRSSTAASCTPLREGVLAGGQPIDRTRPPRRASGPKLFPRWGPTGPRRRRRWAHRPGGSRAPP